MWLLAYIYNYWGDRTDTGLFNDEARNDAHIASASVRLH